LQAQSARSDLLKWKLGLVGVIGGIGLGLAGSRSSAHADLVLCVIPLVCAYVDLLARHLSLRMLVIGGFIREKCKATPLQGYENYAQDHRKAFGLEESAVTWSTVVISAGVCAFGVVVLLEPAKDPIGWAFIGTALVGSLLTVLVWRAYKTRENELRRTKKEGSRGDGPQGDGPH
jgi:hypothetical protein